MPLWLFQYVLNILYEKLSPETFCRLFKYRRKKIIETDRFGLVRELSLFGIQLFLYYIMTLVVTWKHRFFWKKDARVGMKLERCL